MSMSASDVITIPINVSASGDLVAAISGKSIRVVSYALVVAEAVTVKFQSGASTDLTGAMSFAANGGISCPESYQWFKTTQGEKLNIVLGSGVSVQGHLSYQLDPR